MVPVHSKPLFSSMCLLNSNMNPSHTYVLYTRSTGQLNTLACGGGSYAGCVQ